MNLVDSHCHLHLMDLTPYNQQIQPVLDAAKAKGVHKFLCVAVELANHDILCEIARKHKEVMISVGLHPDHEVEIEPTVNELINLAKPCVAIGETGLDYFRVTSEEGHKLQQERFRTHIQAAIATKKPLIIHTREARRATLEIMQTENAKEVGGVMHCFTESWEVAVAAMELGFYISFSGIVTFKNAAALQDVAKRMPLDRILIETDSPYLAPTPFRGKPNQPAYVYYVAEMLAKLRNEPLEQIALATSENFARCFNLAEKI
ncbi:MAG: hypothetical protein A3F18_04030 [Legionellales bacterium RIFCSPHIGHO2_12_FULL_37_14]|nr:MAG: hypothetical protein A3F18_04030 [Legionellales bacterium RIFCSPHIGHO2_12_FULL_37_14]